MVFWIKEEYLKFSEAIMDKSLFFHALELLYWMRIREGELLSLTPADFDLDYAELSITKSYQCLRGVDTITDPKTSKSVRQITMPKFLNEEIREFLELRDDLGPHDRIFAVTTHFLSHEMKRGCAESGVKRIRIHDLRHSYVSLLINMGFSALAIAEKVGHESADIIYRYAHLFPTKQAEMANTLNEIRGGWACLVLIKRERETRRWRSDSRQKSMPFSARGMTRAA